MNLPFLVFVKSRYAIFMKHTHTLHLIPHVLLSDHFDQVEMVIFCSILQNIPALYHILFDVK